MSRKAREFRSATDPVLAKLSPADRATILATESKQTDTGLEYVKSIRRANVKALGDVNCPEWYVATALEVMALQAKAIAEHTASQAAKIGK